jgi:NAD(P)-dependent dehydrogenase (short-subunit alcohol dehydrogenase family)
MPPRRTWSRRLDIVCANAGITTTGTSWELSEEVWQEMLDINLTGVWHIT